MNSIRDGKSNYMIVQELNREKTFGYRGLNHPEERGAGSINIALIGTEIVQKNNLFVLKIFTSILFLQSNCHSRPGVSLLGIGEAVK